jgi:hypothetical protein
MTTPEEATRIVKQLDNIVLDCGASNHSFIMRTCADASRALLAAEARIRVLEEAVTYLDAWGSGHFSRYAWEINEPGATIRRALAKPEEPTSP